MYYTQRSLSLPMLFYLSSLQDLLELSCIITTTAQRKGGGRLKEGFKGYCGDYPRRET